jgi:Transposase zinc-ribbon domain
MKVCTMTKSLSDSIFHDETAARAWFETMRWPDGPVCPHCKWTKHYPTKKTGVYRCADMTCMRDLTVKTGTVMACSPAKLTQWEVRSTRRAGQDLVTTFSGRTSRVYPEGDDAVCCSRMPGDDAAFGEGDRIANHMISRKRRRRWHRLRV